MSHLDNPSRELQQAIKVLQEVTPVVDAGDDFLTIMAAEERISHTAEKRKKELEASQSKLKGTARNLESARVSSTRPPTVPSLAEHHAQLNSLESTRLSLAKAINDCGMAQAQRDAELSVIKDDTRSLEQSDPSADHEKNLDSMALRIEFFKGLGFEPTMDVNGRMTKMLIRSSSGDVHCIPINPSAPPSVQEVRRLWKLASS